MKVLFSFLVLSVATSQAQAANYKTTFAMNNPGVHCENENMSRFTGREVSIYGETFDHALLTARTADRSIIHTEIRGLVTVESGKSCDSLEPSPSVLSGSREMYISRMEDNGKCNAYIVDEIFLNIGEGNPTLFGKTAYPVIGDDFSVWSADICKLTEKDFNKAIQKRVNGQR